MSTIGPTSPEHYSSKRSRECLEEDDEDLEALNVPPTKRTCRSSSPPSEDTKPRRVAGPSAPPAPIDEMPPGPLDAGGEDEESSDDDDYGPAPIAQIPTSIQTTKQRPQASAFDTDPAHTVKREEADKPKRDEWMMMPPKADDLSRVDPLKPHAKGFATGRSARDPSQKDGPSTMWTESMEQKQKRLQDEVMGVERPKDTQKDVIGDSRRKAEENEKTRQARSHADKQSTKSLYEQHQKSAAKKEEDDPSLRAFSYEKDVAKGPKLGYTQKKEMMNRAADFGSKFSSGSYL
ncbi:MAG: hypothetical protein M1828_005403 [Chrysothrix sp. TS-e1954]|nr:MAG: hypothetical protein M1828_005403 [Chrysothrix sp. TS-e1954]